MIAKRGCKIQESTQRGAEAIQADPYFPRQAAGKICRKTEFDWNNRCFRVGQHGNFLLVAGWLGRRAPEFKDSIFCVGRYLPVRLREREIFLRRLLIRASEVLTVA